MALLKGQIEERLEESTKALQNAQAALSIPVTKTDMMIANVNKEISQEIVASKRSATAAAENSSAEGGVSVAAPPSNSCMPFAT